MSKAHKLCFAFSDKVEIKWSAMNGMGESFPTVYVNGKIDKEKTKNLRLAIAKVGWANLKDLAPELIAELVGVNDVKTLLDSDASFSKQSLSFLSLLLTYFPAKKAINLYKAMEAARLLEKGGDLALDLAKISKTFGLTEKEAKVLNEMWEAERIAGKTDDISKFSFELKSPSTFENANIKNVEKYLDEELKGYTKSPLKRGDGVRYFDGKGNSWQLNYGYENASDAIHGGPYLKTTINGEIVRIPLKK